MENKKTKKPVIEIKQPADTCVCSMEWRGLGGDLDNDCICEPHEN